MTVLVVAEHDNETLRKSTLHAVTAAGEMGNAVHLLVAGCHCGHVVEAATGVSGISRVLVADAAPYADFMPENLADLVVSIARQYSHVIAAATTAGKDFMPRVAAGLDVAQISDILSVEDPDTFVRPVYAGNVLATIRSADPIKVLTVRTTAFPAAGQATAPAPVEAIPSLPDFGLSKLIRRELTQSERPELTAARIVVSGGRGVGSGEAYRQLLEPVADKLGAALGASRAAVDAGYVPNDFQVGQTGKIVAPDLYIAVGISGAIQHLAGMKDSRVIVAINKDAEAPIFRVADYGLVGDLFELMPQLADAL